MNRRIPLALAGFVWLAPGSGHAADPAATPTPASAFPPAPAATEPSAPPAPAAAPEGQAPPAPAAVEQTPAPPPPPPAMPAPAPQTLDTPDPAPEPRRPETAPNWRSNRPETGPGWRSSFFGSIALGPGLFHASSGAQSDKRSFSGGSVSGHLAIGSRTQRGLVLGAAYSHDAIYSLSSEDEVIDGDEPNLDDVRFSMSLFAFLIDIYPKGDVGPHLELQVGVANLNVSRNQGSNDIDDPTGLAASIGAGYNFRVGEKTSVGGLLRLLYAPISVEEQSGTSVDAVIPALLLTGSLF